MTITVSNTTPADNSPSAANPTAAANSTSSANTDMPLEEKLASLIHRLRNMGRVMIAFSGGVDSTFLLKIAGEVLGKEVLAVTAKSCTFPERELNAARDFCLRHGIPHLLLESDEMADSAYRQNPPNRCYICKKHLFGKILLLAEELGYPYVAEGSNLDDLADYRPGRLALEEMGIASPLLEAGLSKADIRILSQQRGLDTWDKPSIACLASRIPYGEEITEQKLQMVEQAEQYLLSLGLKQVRVRHHGDIARIEVPVQDLSRIIEPETAAQITQAFAEIGFLYTALDLSGYRSGSMNKKLEVKGQADQKA